MSSSYQIQESIDNLSEEKKQLLTFEQQMLAEITRQNTIREQEVELRQKELEQGKEHDRIIEEKTKASIVASEVAQKEIEIQKVKIQQDKERIEIMTHILDEIRELLEINRTVTNIYIPKQNDTLQQQHQKLDKLIEFQLILIPSIQRLLRMEGDVKTSDILADILRSVGGPAHVNVGTTFTKDFKAQDVNIAEGNSTITK